jgi:hypothetical protein
MLPSTDHIGAQDNAKFLTRHVEKNRNRLRSTIPLNKPVHDYADKSTVVFTQLKHYNDAFRDLRRIIAVNALAPALCLR